MKYYFKKLVVVLALLSLVACAGTPYVKGGFGIKLDENEVQGNNVCESKISFRGEVGVTYDYIIVGAAHHSQPFCGWPVNNKYEPFKTEVFIDFYKTF